MHVQSVHHLFCPCRVSTPSFTVMSISSTHVYSVDQLLTMSCYPLDLTCALLVRISPLQQVHYLSCLRPVRIPPQCIHMSSQNTILLPLFSRITTFSAHVQSVWHHSCPNLVSTSSLTHITISLAHVHSKCHLSCQCLLRIPHIQPKSYQYTTSPAQVHAVRIPPQLLMFSQYTISPAQV